MRPLVAFVVAAALVSCGQAAAPAVATTPPPTPTIAPTPTPTPQPTPSPSPSAAATSYLRVMSGYEWVDPPPELETALVRAFASAEMQNLISEQPVVRLVTQRGEPTSLVLLVLPLKSSYAALPGTLDAIGKGFSATAPTELTVGGRRSLLFVENEQHQYKSLVWMHRSLILWLYGFNKVNSEAMTTFSAQLIAANQ